MAHMTAGDISPIYFANENTYGTPASPLTYYGDVAEGGAIKFTDTPNPHLAWRYGSRAYDSNDYVNTHLDAGFNASMEICDKLGWYQPFAYAYTTFGTSLPSRTVFIRTSDANERHEYIGCKTDALTVSADVPGGIVKFDETVLAAGCILSASPSLSAPPTNAAVQWTGGLTINGSTIYPQRFSISINNNLERIRGPKIYQYAEGRTGTRALVEGRCEITLEAEIWLDDFNYIDEATANNTISAASLTLGIAHPATVSLTNLRHMADGQHPDLKQDKMTQTLRFRAGTIAVA